MVFRKHFLSSTFLKEIDFNLSSNTDVVQYAFFISVEVNNFKSLARCSKEEDSCEFVIQSLIHNKRVDMISISATKSFIFRDSVEKALSPERICAVFKEELSISLSQSEYPFRRYSESHFREFVRYYDFSLLCGEKINIFIVFKGEGERV